MEGPSRLLEPEGIDAGASPSFTNRACIGFAHVIMGKKLCARGTFKIYILYSILQKTTVFYTTFYTTKDNGIRPRGDKQAF